MLILITRDHQWPCILVYIYISFPVYLLFEALVDTSIPTYHLNFQIFITLNFLYGRAINLLIDAIK